MTVTENLNWTTCQERILMRRDKPFLPRPGRTMGSEEADMNQRTRWTKVVTQSFLQAKSLSCQKFGRHSDSEE